MHHSPTGPATERAQHRMQLESNVVNLGDNLAAALAARRHIVGGDGSYDPRFLVFEYTTGWRLKRAQVDLVQEFVGAAAAGRSTVRQMLMGGGKTACISPLLVMFLADGRSLTVQVRVVQVQGQVQGRVQGRSAAALRA